MSMGGGDDTAAKQQADMDRREAERQAKVKQGKGHIDKAYSQFDDDYYGDYQNSITDYYHPQLEDQYGTAVGQMVSSLAGRGIGESTVGNDQRAKLLEENNRQRVGITDQAVDSANKLRGTVENSKTDLYSLNEASADPEAMNARAVGEATALVAPATLSPLAQIFTAALSPFLAYQSASQGQAGPSYQSPIYTQQPNYGSGGSGTVHR
jgi:hypothetical protein